MTNSTQPTSLTCAKIAEITKGELIGSAHKPISGLATLEAPSSNAISFARKLSKLQMKETLCSNNIGALFLDNTIDKQILVDAAMPVILVQDPQKAILSLVPHFYPQPKLNREISAKADIDPSAIIGKDVHIAAFVSVGADTIIADSVTIYANATIYPGVKIGQRTTVHAGAVIRERTEIGDDCVIQPGAIVGGDGFGYLPDPKLGLVSVPQVGIASLGNRVDIGANSCIDRAAIGQTRIDNGAKIDNLVQVGHNVKVGSHAILCGQVGIAGSCDIGAGAVLGGRVGVADHITVAPGARFAGASVISGDIRDPGDYAGVPARPVREWRRQTAWLARQAKSVPKEK